MKIAQIRYHPKFKGRGTLLFAGSRNDIDRLRSFFIGWDGEGLDLIKHLKAQEELYLFSAEELNLRRDRIKSSFIWKGNKGIWFISSAYKQTYVGLLDGLLESDTPGHQYLDFVGPGHVQIMVSKDELPISPSGKVIEGMVLSRGGIAFTTESVAVVRQHVKSYEQRNIVPCLSAIIIEKHGQPAVYLAGNSIESHAVMRPPAIADQLEDASFYWHTGFIDLIRKNYYIDLDLEENCYLLPLPENPVSVKTGKKGRKKKQGRETYR